MKVRTTVLIDKHKLDRARRLLNNNIIWNSLSDLVEDTIDTLDMDFLITNLIKHLDVDMVFPSHKEIINRRPKVKDLSVNIMREIRGKRT